MNARENALRIINFDNPERVVSTPPAYVLAWLGCNHEGYQGGGHDSPVGMKWTDVWGVDWHKVQDGVMGISRGQQMLRIDQEKQQPISTEIETKIIEL